MESQKIIQSERESNRILLQENFQLKTESLSSCQTHSISVNENVSVEQKTAIVTEDIQQNVQTEEEREKSKKKKDRKKKRNKRKSQQSEKQAITAKEQVSNKEKPPENKNTVHENSSNLTNNESLDGHNNISSKTNQKNPQKSDSNKERLQPLKPIANQHQIIKSIKGKTK